MYDRQGPFSNRENIRSLWKSLVTWKVKAIRLCWIYVKVHWYAMWSNIHYIVYRSLKSTFPNGWHCFNNTFFFFHGCIYLGFHVSQENFVRHVLSQAMSVALEIFYCIFKTVVWWFWQSLVKQMLAIHLWIKSSGLASAGCIALKLQGVYPLLSTWLSVQCFCCKAKPVISDMISINTNFAKQKLFICGYSTLFSEVNITPVQSRMIE